MLFLGPFTDKVVKDFWLMIWQERPSAIVMVTEAVENGRVGVPIYQLSNLSVFKIECSFTMLRSVAQS